MTSSCSASLAAVTLHRRSVLRRPLKNPDTLTRPTMCSRLWQACPCYIATSLQLIMTALRDSILAPSVGTFYGRVALGNSDCASVTGDRCSRHSTICCGRRHAEDHYSLAIFAVLITLSHLS